MFIEVKATNEIRHDNDLHLVPEEQTWPSSEALDRSPRSSHLPAGQLSIVREINEDYFRIRSAMDALKICERR
jgi:hypothetical protein